MENYFSQIAKIKKEFPTLQKENFEAAKSGTRHWVFLSNKYVIRLRDENPELLEREANFLKQLEHPLIPKVLWTGTIDQTTAMVENRLPGEPLNLVWKNLSKIAQGNIVLEVVKFLQYLKTQTRNYIYSVNTGKKYRNFWDFLLDGVDQKIVSVKRFQQSRGILKDLLLIINNTKTKDLFTKTKITLVHGDLIIHNLLTDGKSLTGVLDWEMALFGDPDYDLCRLFYYRECAKAYQEQGIDETFEADYMDKLTAEILKSNLIEDKKIFQEKYQFIRAIFYLNALNWASNSNNPEKDLEELVVLWNKSRAKQFSA